MDCGYTTAMTESGFLDWLVRARGAIAALTIHIAVVALLITNDVSPDNSEADPVLVSIVEWPEMGAPNTDPDASAPDYSPKPLETEKADVSPGMAPAASEKAVVENAAPLADPNAPDSPSDTQAAPYSEIARGPVEPAEPVETKVERRPQPEFANPWLNLSPGPAQRVAAAVQCARLTPSQRVNCPTKAMEDYAVASVVADVRAARPLYDPFLDVLVANAAFSGWRARQMDPYEHSPYRLSNTSRDAYGRGSHRQNPAFAANQATADMAGQIIRHADPVWGD
ncbi:MAG: hypothetical protein AAFS03_05745 [Pseudomonadota bacterium]